MMSYCDCTEFGAEHILLSLTSSRLIGGTNFRETGRKVSPT